MCSWTALQYHCSASHSHSGIHSHLQHKMKKKKRWWNKTKFQPDTPNHFCDFEVAWVVVCLSPGIYELTLQHFATVMLHIGEWVTHPFSRHTLIDCQGDCTSFFVIWLSEGKTWKKKKSVTWVEHRISAASRYRRPRSTRLLARGFPWLSCSIVALKDTAVLSPPPSLSICQHTISLSCHISLFVSCKSLPICLLCQANVVEGDKPVSKQIMTFHQFSWCNIKEIRCYKHCILKRCSSDVKFAQTKNWLRCKCSSAPSSVPLTCSVVWFILLKCRIIKNTFSHSLAFSLCGMNCCCSAHFAGLVHCILY